MRECNFKYSHEIEYYKYGKQLIGVIPSLDKVFTAKKLNGYPTSVISKQKPLFHESYKRKPRIKRVFVLTNACNLHCAYCFEGNPDKLQMMPNTTIKAGIEEMFREAIEQELSLISFSLFGGEPTMNWSAIETAVATATELERSTGIRCYKAIVTNGVMPEEYCKALAKMMDFIYFSFDGPKELFLQQRKPRGDVEIYETILQNAGTIYNIGTYLSFKVTVSKLTIDYLKEIDDFFTWNFPTCSRLYQPCMVDTDSPLYISFGDFLEKYYELKQYSVFSKNMTTSLHKNIPSDRFCNLMIRNVVYPDGTVLACHRSNMCIPDDQVKATFRVGYCDDIGYIRKDQETCKWLETFTVNEIAECRLCPFRYHCCGGCPTVKLLSGNGNPFRKANYCDSYLRFIFTDLITRLNQQKESYLVEMPRKITFNDYAIEWDMFEENVVETIISMEA